MTFRFFSNNFWVWVESKSFWVEFISLKISRVASSHDPMPLLPTKRLGTAQANVTAGTSDKFVWSTVIAQP